MKTTKSYILYGPQGSGKNLIAPELAKVLGLSRIEDDWDGRARSFRAVDTLHITNDRPAFVGPDARRVLSVTEARALLPHLSAAVKAMLDSRPA